MIQKDYDRVSLDLIGWIDSTTLNKCEAIKMVKRLIQFSSQ